MAGLYIHVPFCRKRCIYCDFYSNTEMKYKIPYIHAICQEMRLRKEFISGEEIETIYFGGGTPSQLSAEDFQSIFQEIYTLFSVKKDSEVTIEVNPDDITPAYLSSLSSLPINRISMGIQSFDDEDLDFLNRRHTAQQAVEAIELCKEYGYTNLSIDLIYGLPGQTIEKWMKNLEITLQIDIPHVSAYHLIYEEGTPLYKLKEAATVHPVNDETSIQLFTLLIKELDKAGFQHYEISNFAKPGFISQHNSSYWCGKKYLGIGPSAHSYDGESRQWNVASLARYIKGIKEEKPDLEIELLDIRTRYNDYIITHLRTMWGIDLEEIKRLFGTEFQEYCIKQALPYIKKQLILQKEDILVLGEKGIFISDGIMSDLLKI